MCDFLTAARTFATTLAIAPQAGVRGLTPSPASGTRRAILLNAVQQALLHCSPGASAHARIGAVPSIQRFGALLNAHVSSTVSCWTAFSKLMWKAARAFKKTGALVPKPSLNSRRRYVDDC